MSAVLYLWIIKLTIVKQSTKTYTCIISLRLWKENCYSSLVKRTYFSQQSGLDANSYTFKKRKPAYDQTQAQCKLRYLIHVHRLYLWSWLAWDLAPFAPNHRVCRVESMRRGRQQEAGGWRLSAPLVILSSTWNRAWMWSVPMLSVSWWGKGQHDCNRAPPHNLHSKLMWSLKLSQITGESNLCTGFMSTGFLWEFYPQYTTNLHEWRYALRFPKLIWNRLLLFYDSC